MGGELYFVKGIMETSILQDLEALRKHYSALRAISMLNSPSKSWHPLLGEVRKNLETHIKREFQILKMGFKKS